MLIYEQLNSKLQFQLVFLEEEDKKKKEKRKKPRDIVTILGSRQPQHC